MVLPDLSYGPPRQRRRRRLRPRHGIFVLLLIVVLLFILQVGLNPWVLHIGGKFTPSMSWSGYGTVTASNGGKYVLETHFTAGYLLATKEANGSACDSQSGCDDIRGTAKLCAENGKTETFQLLGDVHSWLATEGALTSLYLDQAKPTPLQDGWLVAFRGNWHGDALDVASPDNSFTEEFTPQGGIRTVTSTADAGTATVSLKPGSDSQFLAACRALTGKS